MHRVIAACSLVSALVLSSWATADAQYVPAGSYQLSCRNLTMNANQLSASCTDPQGRYITSSVNAYACGNGDIANVNGYLHCNGNGSNGLPPGSYPGSCVNATMRGAILSASCTSPSGSRIFSSLDVTQCGGGNVKNANGLLACGTGSGNGGWDGRGGGRWLPNGSYRQSCSDAYMRGALLTATCPSGNGTRMQSSLVTAGCRGGDIANLNGRLACNFPR